MHIVNANDGDCEWEARERAPEYVTLMAANIKLISYVIRWTRNRVAVEFRKSSNDLGSFAPPPLSWENAN